MIAVVAVAVVAAVVVVVAAAVVVVVAAAVVVVAAALALALLAHWLSHCEKTTSLRNKEEKNQNMDHDIDHTSSSLQGDKTVILEEVSEDIVGVDRLCVCALIQFLEHTILSVLGRNLCSPLPVVILSWK